MISTLLAATIGWIICGIFAVCAVSLIWIVFYVTRAPTMIYYCPKCGEIDDHDEHGNCMTCGLGVELWNRKGGGK